MTNPQDPAQEFAEKVAKEFWKNFNLSSSPDSLLQNLIASELRAGGWIKRGRHHVSSSGIYEAEQRGMSAKAAQERFSAMGPPYNSEALDYARRAREAYQAVDALGDIRNKM